MSITTVGGYQIIDFKGIELDPVTPPVVPGIFKLLTKNRKAVQFVNFIITNIDNEKETVLTPVYAAVKPISSGDLYAYLPAYHGGIQITDDDQVLFALD